MLRSLIKSCKQVAEGLTSGVPLGPKPVVLAAFDSPRAVERWHVFTDAFFGGKSDAALTYNEGERAAEFSGRVTLDQEQDADLRRGGYAVASSKVVALGDYLDVSGASHLVYELKGDGRAYIASVRVDSMAGTGGDVWQAPFRTRAGRWSTVRIPIESLALTYQGQLVERKLEFQAEKVIGVGVAVSAALDGGAHEATPEAGSSGGSSGEAAVDSSGGGGSSSGGAEAAGSSGGCDDSGTVAAAAGSAHERFRLLIREIRAESAEGGDDA